MGLDDEDVVQLCRIGLFQSISPRDIMFLVRVSHTVIAESGTTVVKQNTMADFFYVIVDGLLRVRIHLPNGSSIVPIYLTRGQYAGDPAIMEGKPRGGDLEAARDTRLVRVPGFTLRRIMSRPENRWRYEAKQQAQDSSNARLAARALSNPSGHLVGSKAG